MTDMRATERLLEVIWDEADKAGEWINSSTPGREDGVIAALQQVMIAVTELRRRGDTLVRREDLRTVLKEASFPSHPAALDLPVLSAILDRLENAIGGKA